MITRYYLKAEYMYFICFLKSKRFQITIDIWTQGFQIKNYGIVLTFPQCIKGNRDMNNGKSRKRIKIADTISNNMPDNDYQTTAGVAKMDMHWE